MSERQYALKVALGPIIIDLEVGALDVTMRPQAFEKGGDDFVGSCARATAEICNPPRPLVECSGKRRQRRRPRRGRAAEQRDEVASLQPIELHLLPLASEAAYRIGEHQVRSSLHCGIPARLMSPRAHFPQIDPLVRGMSAVLPMATELVTRGSPSLGANSGPMHRSKTTSLDDLVGAGEQHRRHVEAERLSRFEIDHQLILGRRLHWQVGGLLTLEDAVNVTGRASVWLDRIWTIRDQAAVDDEEAQPIDCRQSVLSRKRDDQLALNNRQR